MSDENFYRHAQVDTVSGIFYDPDKAIVRLQYVSGDVTYEIPFPLEEALRMEEYFIMVRRGIAKAHRDQS
ncbi:MAG: hypothetical protein J5I92_11430 [Thiogranum sp.]|nr:hypothetical protein [Thiogranum sp.]